jgi:hypothetical protein
MEQDLKLKGVSPATIRNYLLYCRKFAAFFMRSPEELGAAEVRAFLLHEIEVEQLAYASYRQVYAALKFLYSVTLGRPGEVSRIPFPKRQPSRLPKALTVGELSRPVHDLLRRWLASGRGLPFTGPGHRFATPGHSRHGQGTPDRPVTTLARSAACLLALDQAERLAVSRRQA